MNIITIDNKSNMSNEFYIKRKMCALEWKVNAMISENRNLIYKLNRNWTQPINKKFESCRV